MQLVLDLEVVIEALALTGRATWFSSAYAAPVASELMKEESVGLVLLIDRAVGKERK